MTAWADYGYYRDTFGGTLTEAEYARAALPAAALLESWTGRAAPSGSSADRMRRAACALADALTEEERPRLLSASNDGVSETYVSDGRSRSERLWEAASLYLQGTGLLSAWIL